jgi:hypothetical protein
MIGRPLRTLVLTASTPLRVVIVVDPQSSDVPNAGIHVITPPAQSSTRLRIPPETLEAIARELVS